MKLDAIDRELLDGGFGPAAAVAMRLLERYGRARGAEHFLSIDSAHIDSCLYHGPSSIDFATHFTRLGGKVRVSTTTNVGAVDSLNPRINRGDPAIAEAQRQLNRLYVQLGCAPTLTCAPYQRAIRPRFGSHIAWAESNAIVFANSVLGARTDRYGDFADLAAALTGRVPAIGLHLDTNRRADIAFEVAPLQGSGLPRDLYFAAVGYAIGAASGGRVPALLGLPDIANEDDWKALGASAASSGAVALFHAVGHTPEAATLSEASGNRDIPVQVLDAAALRTALAKLERLGPGEPIRAICLGTPHFSHAQFEELAHLVAGRRAAAGVEVWVSTSREIASMIQSEPVWSTLEAFGVELVVDTCTYVAPVIRGSGSVLTNSAKWAHYGPGNLGRRAGLATLERCIRSAELGQVCERAELA